MRYLLPLLILFAVPGFQNLSDASIINFDLRAASVEDIDEVASFGITNSGLLGTFSANSGVLNRTGSGFGINAVGGSDDTDQIDNDELVEILTISFSKKKRSPASRLNSARWAQTTQRF